MRHFIRWRVLIGSCWQPSAADDGFLTLNIDKQPQFWSAGSSDDINYLIIKFNVVNE